MEKVLLCLTLAMAGCASSTGVVSMGQGTYMASHTDNGIAATVGAVKAAALKDAADFCAGKGLDFAVIKSTDIPRGFGKMPQSTVEFKCVAK